MDRQSSPARVASRIGLAWISGPGAWPSGPPEIGPSLLNHLWEKASSLFNSSSFIQFCNDGLGAAGGRRGFGRFGGPGPALPLANDAGPGLGWLCRAMNVVYSDGSYLTLTSSRETIPGWSRPAMTMALALGVRGWPSGWSEAGPSRSMWFYSGTGGFDRPVVLVGPRKRRGGVYPRPNGPRNANAGGGKPPPTGFVSPASGCE